MNVVNLLFLEPCTFALCEREAVSLRRKVRIVRGKIFNIHRFLNLNSDGPLYD